MPEWERVRLGDVAQELTVGFVGPMASEYRDHGVPFLRSQNVLPHVLDLRDVKFISSGFHQRIAKSRLRPGDVVTVRTGKPGTTAWIPPGTPEMNCADLVITRPGPRVDGRWLSYYLNSAAGGYIANYSVGAVQQHFNVGAAKSIELNLPLFAEQQSIARVLGALDDKMAANEGIAATSVSLLGRHVEAMRIDDVADPERTPVTLHGLFELNPPVRAPDEDEPVYVAMQDLPTSDMTVSSWSHRQAKGGARFQNGDTLLARITPCLENRKTGFADFLAGDSVGLGSTEYIVVRSRVGVPAVLSYFVAISERFREFAIRHMVGTSGRQRVSARDLSDYQLVRPEVADLARFDTAAKPLLDMMASLRDENRHLTELRDTLLPELISGRLRVCDAERQVEDVL